MTDEETKKNEARRKDSEFGSTSPKQSPDDFSGGGGGETRTDEPAFGSTARDENPDDQELDGEK